jgi:hypothetical protein
LSKQEHCASSTRATLVVTDVGQTTAITGYCDQCSSLKLRNIQANGSRPILGLIYGAVKIEVGGPRRNQLVDHVFHIIHSRTNGCQTVTITKNDMGPSGEFNKHWADDISIACTKSTGTNRSTY